MLFLMLMEYLFIVDSNNNRIVGQGPHGFRCLIGCDGSSGILSYPLDNPQTISFDNYGNIFVADKHNDQIQMFLLLNNSGSKFNKSYRSF